MILYTLLILLMFITNYKFFRLDIRLQIEGLCGCYNLYATVCNQTYSIV